MNWRLGVLSWLVAIVMLGSAVPGLAELSAVPTIAGDGSAGYSGDGGPATIAKLNRPYGVFVDGAGHRYIADTWNHRVRKVDANTGLITTVAGIGTAGYSGDGGPATSAGLNQPSGVVVDGAGNLYIADAANHRIRKVDTSTGVITTIAGNGTAGYSGDAGPAASARLNQPSGVALDGMGNLLIADAVDCRIRQVAAVTGAITTVAGDGNRGYSGDGGPATSASLNAPSGVAVDGVGNLYITDKYNHRIRKVDTSTGAITTMAGDGTEGYSGDGGVAANAKLNQPSGAFVDGGGNLYIADSQNHRIRRVDVSTGIITTFAGPASLNQPCGVAVDAAGHLYIADTGNSRIGRVEAGIMSTIAGNGTAGGAGDGGPATSASLYSPKDVALDGAGNLYIADVHSLRVRKVDAGTGIITTVAGGGTAGYSGDGGPATIASLNRPSGIVVDDSGNLYIADAANHRIRRVEAGTGIITTVAGDGTAGYAGDAGPGIFARLSSPQGVAVDGAGNLYIVDTNNHRIRKLGVSAGIITTVAGDGTAGYSGDGGPAISARLNLPRGVALDGGGNLYIADTENHRIRRREAGTGILTTVVGGDTGGYAGDGGPATSARLSLPSGVALDGGGHLYIADAGNSRIRKVDAGTGTITTVAGNGTAGYSGDGAATLVSLHLSDPYRNYSSDPYYGFGYSSCVTVDGAGSLYIADQGNQRIRKVEFPAMSPSHPPTLGAHGGATLSTMTPTLAWSGVAYATSYTLQYAPIASFAGATTIPGLTATQYTFPAPLAVGTYYWRVKALTAGGASSSFSGADSFVIEVPNLPPVASAGPDQTVAVGAQVTLDGRGSRDPDGFALTYLWTPPAGVTLDSRTTRTPTFTAGTVGTCAIRLVVNDGQVDSAPDTVVVTVQRPNRPPVASAGPDRTVAVGVTVTLDGSASQDSDGDPLSYRWTAPPGITLSSTTQVRPTFVANAPGTFRLALVVNDGHVDSVPDTVAVEVQATGAPGRTLTAELPGGATMGFVWIPPGTFTMGSPSTEVGRAANEGPQHQVTVSRGFYLAETEITQGQWVAVIGTTPWSGRDFVQSNPSHPAVFISWEDVQAFAHRLNQAAGDSVYRLPTEAEWEYACRAGTTTAWSFGDDASQVGEYAWYGAWSGGTPYAHAVGSKQPSPWGLYDMHGNVYEWVHDWWGDYSSGSQVDPTGPSSGMNRVLRGGCFGDAAQYLRSAGRYGDSPPGRRDNNIGARLLRVTLPTRTDTPPESDAGTDQRVTAGAAVQLDGSRSTDADGDALTYRWTAPSGITLSSVAVVRPTFTAGTAGTYRFALTVNDGHVDSAPDTVVVLVSPASPAQADMRLSASRLAFGEVPVRGRSEQPLEIENLGQLPLRVDSVRADSPQYSATPDSLVVPAGQRMVLTVAFVPAAAGEVAGQLVLVTNDPDEPRVTVALNGRGRLLHVTASTDTLAFGRVLVGQSGTQVLTVINNTASAVTVTNVVPGDLQYAVSSRSFTLAAGGSRDITVTYTPVEGRSPLATLTLVTNDTEVPVLSVELAATSVAVGGPPAISVLPTSLTFGSVALGQSKSVTLLVTNEGEATSGFSTSWPAVMT